MKSRLCSADRARSRTEPTAALANEFLSQTPPPSKRQCPRRALLGGSRQIPHRARGRPGKMTAPAAPPSAPSPPSSSANASPHHVCQQSRRQLRLRSADRPRSRTEPAADPANEFLHQAPPPAKWRCAPDAASAKVVVCASRPARQIAPDPAPNPRPSRKIAEDPAPDADRDSRSKC